MLSKVGVILIKLARCRSGQATEASPWNLVTRRAITVAHADRASIPSSSAKAET
jgi:hypothetical protein